MVSSLLFSIFLASSLSSIAFAAPTNKGGSNLDRDRATLQAFAKTLKSDPSGNITKTWTGTDVCKFEGITCDVTPEGYKAVAGIDINNYNLTANLLLTGLLDNLLDITFFHANTNNFVGSVPDVSKLKYLYEIDVSNNGLSGPFPTHVLAAPLTFLDLRFNQFTGPLPKELFTTTDMDVIFLNDNKFSGPIPETGNISTMYITLANNQFTGPIPASLGNNKGLKEILLLGNQLTGTVPEELCALPLDVLDVSNNKLSGTLGPKCQALLKKGVLKIDGNAIKA